MKLLKECAIEKMAGALKQIENGGVYRDGAPGKTPKTRARAILAELGLEQGEEK